MTNLKNTGLVSAFTLKLIMAALMVGDHMVYFFPHDFPIELRFAARVVAPVFCYLMTVSLYHTRDRGRYVGRLMAGALVMFAGNLALAHALNGPKIVLNIFFSLAVSAALIDRIEALARRKGKPFLQALCIIFLIVACFHVEGQFLLPVMALVFYFLKDNKPMMYLCYILAGACVVWLAGIPIYQQYQALAIIPIALYNGKKGADSAFSKWFFYFFYPLHIWALYIIRHLIFRSFWF